MKEENVVLVIGFRKVVDVDVVEELEEMGGVEVMEWWELMGWDEEGTVVSLKRRRMVGPDGVHLSVSVNRFAAVSLWRRRRCCTAVVEGPLRRDGLSEKE
jgi:hypothetical protein